MKNFYLFIGTSGTGKTAQLAHISQVDYQCYPEAIRLILEEKIATDGKGFESHETNMFLQKIFQRMKQDHTEASKSKKPVFFDRGSPDLIAYAQRFGLETDTYIDLANSLSYNKKCFVFPPWKEIFINDPLRGLSFEEYSSFHKKIVSVYEGMNFELIEMPYTSVQNRTNFIIDHID